VISALFKSKPESIPAKADVPLEVNVNVKFDELQPIRLKHTESGEEKISETARSIIRRVAIVLVVGAIFAMTAPWLMPPLFVQEIGRVLFVCVLGLLLEYESSKKSKIAIGPYSFEFK
jgi:hypothetical protein